MRRGRGIRVGRKLVSVFKSFFRRKIIRRTGYLRLKEPACTSTAMSKLCNWGRSLKRRARGLCFGKRDTAAYVRIEQEAVEQKAASVPKGHLAVYVGEKDDDTCRVLVPVVYFNHPLFSNLLTEAENVYGFDHPGAIQIPCRISDFENIQTRIEATGGDRRWLENRRIRC